MIITAITARTIIRMFGGRPVLEANPFKMFLKNPVGVLLEFPPELLLEFWFPITGRPVFKKEFTAFQE